MELYDYKIYDYLLGYDCEEPGLLRPTINFASIQTQPNSNVAQVVALSLPFLPCKLETIIPQLWSQKGTCNAFWMKHVTVLSWGVPMNCVVLDHARPTRHACS